MTRDEIVRCAECSVIAYQDRDSAKKALYRIGFRHFTFLESRGTQCFIASNKQVSVISFRGTEATHLEDWLADIRCFRVQGRVGKLHRGFAVAYTAVRKRLLQALKEHQSDSLYLTGHSLGAALATICAADLAKKGYALDGLVTFGSPRVGDSAFAAYVESACPVWRYVHNNDLVPRCPTPLRFQHVGVKQYINTEGKVFQQPSYFYVLFDRIKGYLQDVGSLGLDAIKDHSMLRYYHILAKEFGHEIRELRSADC